MVAQQKSLVLILARELASNIATPMFVLDREGTLVYYNEPAEAVAGQPYSSVGEISATEWGESYSPRAADGADHSCVLGHTWLAVHWTAPQKPLHGSVALLHEVASAFGSAVWLNRVA